MARLDVVLPLSVPCTRKGRPWYLNMNGYRNDHNRILHNAKVSFDALAARLIGRTRLSGTVRLTYTLFYGSNRRIDLANVCAVADKFFSDSLTKAGAIEDDNSSIVQEVRFLWGGVDKANPRIEVAVEETDDPSFLVPASQETPCPQPQECPPMKVNISFDQSDLDTLIREKIATDFPALAGQNLDIQITDAGVSVTLLPAGQKPQEFSGAVTSRLSSPEVGQVASSEPATQAPVQEATEQSGDPRYEGLTKGERSALTRKLNREAAEAAARKLAERAEATDVTKAEPTPVQAAADQLIQKAAATEGMVEVPAGDDIVTIDLLAQFRQEDGSVRMALPEEWATLTEEQQDLYNSIYSAQEDAEPEPEPVPEVKATPAKAPFIPPFLPQPEEAKPAAPTKLFAPKAASLLDQAGEVTRPPVRASSLFANALPPTNPSRGE